MYKLTPGLLHVCLSLWLSGPTKSLKKAKLEIGWNKLVGGKLNGEKESFDWMLRSKPGCQVHAVLHLTGLCMFERSKAMGSPGIGHSWRLVQAW